MLNERESPWAPRVLSVLRIVAGVLFLEHGTSKIFGWPVHVGFLPPHPFSLFWFAGLLELIGSPLILLGLLTRPTAFVLSGFMAVAYFIQLAPKNVFPMNNEGDPAILFCFLFLYLVAAGPGPWSLDALIRRRAATQG
jgi:putative oxidoreductase